MLYASNPFEISPPAHIIFRNVPHLYPAAALDHGAFRIRIAGGTGQMFGDCGAAALADLQIIAAAARLGEMTRALPALIQMPGTPPILPQCKNAVRVLQKGAASHPPGSRMTLLNIGVSKCIL